MDYVLEFDKHGFPIYWINVDDPLHGFSLWKRINKNEHRLIRNIPAKHKKSFESIKDAHFKAIMEM